MADTATNQRIAGRNGGHKTLDGWDNETQESGLLVAATTRDVMSDV